LANFIVDLFHVIAYIDDAYRLSRVVRNTGWYLSGAVGVKSNPPFDRANRTPRHSSLGTSVRRGPHHQSHPRSHPPTRTHVIHFNSQHHHPSLVVFFQRMSRNEEGYYRLNTGAKIPAIGLGTRQAQPGELEQVPTPDPGKPSPLQQSTPLIYHLLTLVDLIVQSPGT